MAEETRFFDSLPEIPEPSAAHVLQGHDALIASLKDEAEQGRLGHAYIFAGAKGIGKATASFALARYLLNEGADISTAALSSQIASGAFPGLVHISRAYDTAGKRFKSGILVDDVRKIGHYLAMTSGNGARRIVIVDGAEDMNRSAANALLKNLEEPPARTTFFLVSHNTSRLLPTIRSRCRMLKFAALSNMQTEHVLRDLDFPADEAKLLASRAKGSPRHAIMLARYGGLDLLQSIEAIFTAKDMNVIAIQDFAKQLSERDREMHYRLALEMIEDRLMDNVRKHIGHNQQEAAFLLTEASDDFVTAAREADQYNIDRKLFLGNALRKLHNIMQKTATLMDFA